MIFDEMLFLMILVAKSSIGIVESRLDTSQTRKIEKSLEYLCKVSIWLQEEYVNSSLPIWYKSVLGIDKPQYTLKAEDKVESLR